MKSTASLVPRTTGLPARTSGSMVMRSLQLIAVLAYLKTAAYVLSGDQGAEHS